jgi:hypothetical protein
MSERREISMQLKETVTDLLVFTKFLVKVL